jgi:hypothetical protein
LRWPITEGDSHGQTLSLTGYAPRRAIQMPTSNPAPSARIGDATMLAAVGEEEQRSLIERVDVPGHGWAASLHSP